MFVGGCGGLAHLMAHLGRTGRRVGLAASSTAGVVIWCRLFGDAEALADCCCDECSVDSWCRSCWLVAIDRLGWILLRLLTVVALLVVSLIVLGLGVWIVVIEVIALALWLLRFLVSSRQQSCSAGSAGVRGAVGIVGCWFL